MADAYLQSAPAVLEQGPSTGYAYQHVSGANAQTASAVLTGTVALPIAAEAGQLLVFTGGFDKNPGTVTVKDNISAGTSTTNGTGWTVVDLTSTSVSLTIAWKVALGGESTITEDHTTAAASGNTLAINSYAYSGPGTWTELGRATNNTDETSVLSWATGTATPTGNGLAFAAWAVDSGTSVIAPNTVTYSNGFVERINNQTGGGRGSHFLAELPASSGVGVTSTLTSAGGTVAADQWSGAVLVIGPQTAGSSFPAAGTVAGTSATSGATVLLVAVSGAVAGTSATAGTLTARLAGTGVSAGVSAAVGAPTSILPTTGSVAAVSGTAGAPIGLLPTSGTSAGTSTVAGSVTTRLPASGSAASSSGTAGAIGQLQSTAGSVAGTSDTAGTLTARYVATGTSPSTSATSGAASLIGGPQVYPAGGTIAATSAATGTLTALLASSGTTSVVSGALGAALARYTAAGSLAATSGTTGTATPVTTASGTVSAVTATAGDAARIPAPVPTGQDVVVLTLVDRSRRVTIREHGRNVAVADRQRDVAVITRPRKVTVVDHPRPVTAKEAP